MARGPLPNPDAQRGGQPWTTLEGSPTPRPEPPLLRTEVAKAWWREYAARPEAEFWLGTDWQRLAMAAVLVDTGQLRSLEAADRAVRGLLAQDGEQ